MATPTITPVYQGPAIAESVPWEIRLHLQQLYQKLGNHVQGISLLNTKVNKLQTGTTSIVEQITGISGGGVVPVPPPTTVGTVNNQTGQTSYSTVVGDNGCLLILSDASPIAVTLAAGAPPYFVMVANLGAGTATLTPAAPPSGTSTISYAANPGAANMPLLEGQFAIIGYDGANWMAAWDIVPVTFTAPTHQVINAYNAVTGLFAAIQLAFSDLSGSLAVGQLPAETAVCSFGTGAPVGSSTDGFLYFDTTGTPYHGYVYHSGAWNQFS